MKNPVLLHNPYCKDSIAFKQYLDSIDFKYCLLSWYSDNGHYKAAQEIERLIFMFLSGAMEGLTAPEPEIEYSEEEIAAHDFPNEYGRWIMNCCDKHREFGYEGPPPRAFPSIILELDNGELGLWDCPSSLEDLVPEKMSCSVEKGICLAGQWIEGAKATSVSKHFGNSIMRESICRYVKKYETLDLSEPERDLVTIERGASKVKEC